MPIKKDKVKKKKIKKPRNASSLVKTIKPKPVYIFTERVPNKKCCTDVYKSGQAYTIPFGFSDRLGTTRLPTAATPPSITPPKEYFTIETQTEKPSKASKKIQVNMKQPVKNLIILDEEEEEPASNPIETQTEPASKPKRKYDTSKAEENKTRLLEQLYQILLINNDEPVAMSITQSYAESSNKKIKEKINREKQLVRKKI
jgi:hypothetical protein